MVAVRAKVLVVEHDEQARQVIDEILTAIRCSYQTAGSLVEAREFLDADQYDCVLLDCEISARPGGKPRRQHAETFMDDGIHVPVIVLYHPMADMGEDDFTAWVCDMTRKGVVKFVRKPLGNGGRTLDRVLKKTLGLTKGDSVKTSAKKHSEGHEKPVTVGSDTPLLATEDIALTKPQMDILEAMASDPDKTMYQVDIIAAAGYGKHAISQHLARLRKLGLVCQPQGMRGGFALSQKGRSHWSGTKAVAGSVSNPHA